MSDTWIVQWYSRFDGAERASGRVEFDNEHDARATYNSPYTQSAVSDRFRVELQRVLATETVESSGYREVTS